MYKIEHKRLPNTRYYLTYNSAKADCKAYGFPLSCIKPVH